MAYISASVVSVLRLTKEELFEVLLRAERLELKLIPDGKFEYIPVSNYGVKFQSIRDGLILSDKRLGELLCVK